MAPWHILSFDIVTPWLVLESYVSEGTLGLIITILAMLALGCFFQSMTVLWNPKYECGRRDDDTPDGGRRKKKRRKFSKIVVDEAEEEFCWLTTSSKVGYGDVFGAIKEIIVNGVSGRLRFGRACEHLAFPIVFYFIVSILSSLTQLSVHSVTAFGETYENATVYAADFDLILDVLSFYSQYYYNAPAGYSFVNDYTLLMPIITGMNQNLDNFYMFTKDGMLCGGTYFDNTDQVVKCIVDTTVCRDEAATLNVSTVTTSSSGDWPFVFNTPHPKLVSFTAQSKDKTSLLLEQTMISFDPTLSGPAYPINNLTALFEIPYTMRLGPTVNVNNLTQLIDAPDEFFYAINRSKIDPTTYPTFTTPLRVGQRYWGAANPTYHDMWQAECDLSASLCDVTIVAGAVKAVTGCEAKQFMCYPNPANSDSSGVLPPVWTGSSGNESNATVAELSPG
ncbi:hypothetical protein HK101_001724, partial [Irineochytrium annulatum]